jgi:hypothetical protein
MTLVRSPLFSSPARREAAGWAALWWVVVTAVSGITLIVERGLS